MKMVGSHLLPELQFCTCRGKRFENPQGRSMVISPLSPTATTCTIANIKQFPWHLRQEDHLLGCIPTSVAAVITYYGEPHLLTERTILGILALAGKVSRICFVEVKADVLDRNSSFKAKFDSS
jgi:hypothetical protein